MLVWQGYDVLFAYFLTQCLGLSAEMMGWIAMALMLFAAIADSVVALWIGRGGGAARRLAGLQFHGALGCAVAFPLLFCCAGSMPPLWHAIGAGLLFQLCYKLYDLPQNALTSVLSHDRAQVLQLSSGRYLLSAGARIVVACAAYRLLQADGRANAWMGLFAVLLALPGLVSAYLLKRELARTSSLAGESSFSRRVGGGYRQFPRGMTILLLVALLDTGTVSVTGRLLPYLGERSHVLVAFALGTLMLLPPFRWLAARRGEGIAFLVASILAATTSLGLSLAYRNGSNDWLLDLLAYLHGGGAFAGTMLLWGATANLIHEHQFRTGLRSDVLVYGLFSFACKVGIALSMWALGQVLGTAAGNAVQLVGALQRSAWLGAGGALSSAILLYPVLCRRRHSSTVAGADPVSGS